MSALFPVLDAVRRSDISALLKATNLPATTTIVPGELRAGIGVQSEFAVDAPDPASDPPAAASASASARSAAPTPTSTRLAKG